MKRKSWLTGILLAALALSLTACGNNQSGSANQQVMNTSTGNEISTLDSSKYGDTTSSEVLQNAMEGLYRFNKKNEVQLAGATKASRSKNQKVYTFNLRKDAKWSNGDPVTAQDYVLAWRRTVDPKNSSLDSDSYAIIKNGTAIAQGKKPVASLGIKALGKYRLQVTLANPIPYLPQILEGAQFYPQDHQVVKRLGNRYGTTSSNLLYIGPFVVKGWIGSKLKWQLMKNQHYWHKNSVSLKRVNMQVIQTPQTGVNLYRSGQLDYVTLTSDFIKQYQNNHNYHTQVTPTNGYLTFNLKRRTTGNVHVRRALSLAVNRQQLVKTVLLAGKAANGQVPSGFIKDYTGRDYRQDAGKMISYELAEAKKEWRLAQKQLGQKRISLELLTSDLDDAKRAGEYLQSNLMRTLPGLTVKVRSIPLKSRLANTTAHNYDFVYGTWQPSYADPLDFLTVGGLFNLEPDYHNRNFWHQINLARANDAVKPKKRLQDLSGAERQLVQKDAFVAPLYQASNAYLLKSKVKGFQLSPYGNVAFYWHVRIK